MSYNGYFTPISDEITLTNENDTTLLGNVIRSHTRQKGIPEYEAGSIAIIGVPESRGNVLNEGCCHAADVVRQKLYNLRKGGFDIDICDIGNLIPGETLNDTYVALGHIMSDLIKSNVFPIIIGGSHDLTYGQYLAYTELDQTVNIVAVDSRFDLGMPETPMNSDNYLGKIVLHQPNILFNFSNIAFQSYFVGSQAIEFMDKLFFDTYRVGMVKSNIEECEPIIRNADILSFDIGAIRHADAPGNINASPNGLTGDEACQLVRYAGLSDKLTSIGFYETNVSLDINEVTSHLTAQMIWYFLDGYYHRKKDYPIRNRQSFLKYRVSMKGAEQEIVFYKSKKSEKWWMEVPCSDQFSRYNSHHIIPCSYKDYLTACEEELPERWWQAFQKLN